MSRPIVVLDPGHGGRDPGAVNQLIGITEAQMTLDVCQRAEALLSNCCEVHVRAARFWVAVDVQTLGLGLGLGLGLRILGLRVSCNGLQTACIRVLLGRG